MEILKSIGRGRKKILASYWLKTDIPVQRHRVLKEISIFAVRKRERYITEIVFLIDDGDRYVQKSVYTTERFYDVIRRLKDDTIRTIQELELL